MFPPSSSLRPSPPRNGPFIFLAFLVPSVPLPVPQPSLCVLFLPGSFSAASPVASRRSRSFHFFLGSLSLRLPNLLSFLAPLISPVRFHPPAFGDPSPWIVQLSAAARPIEMINGGLKIFEHVLRSLLMGNMCPFVLPFVGSDLMEIRLVQIGEG